MFENPFIPDGSTYKREIHPVKDYIEQASLFLSQEKNIPLEQATEYVKRLTVGKQFPTVKFPMIHFLERGENGDRGPKCTKLLDYIYDSVKNKEIVAPTLTTYMPEEAKESLLAVYISDNIAKRSRSKKAMFAAEAAKDFELALFEDGKQRNFKLSNNAISGAHASSSNPLCNPTSHSTLTSNCRMTSAYGNANNEKLLSGNRHYHAPDIVLNNIVSIISHTDYDLLSSVMQKYNLYYPNTEDVIDCITYSSDLYWIDKDSIHEIKSYVDKLTAIQKAAFVYTGDLYHLKKHNEQFIKTFIEGLAKKVYTGCDDPMKVMKEYPEDIAALAHQICSKEMMGKGKDYAKIKDTPELQTVSSTVLNIASVMLEYGDFIKAIMVSDNVPSSVAHFPTSIRRAALTSDTDSTIFTVQDWVLWLNDGKWWGERSIAYGATIIFLASQAIIHILARMSINNGISRKKMYKIAMKNEYYFPVFIPTSVNKHYFATKTCQEGNVYEKPKREVKGVHLKNSNTPKYIIDTANALMNDIMDTVLAGKSISLIKYIKEVSTIEHGIYKGIMHGDAKYFRAGVIKNPDSYSNEPERSPYFHYMLWNEVFAPKYGPCEEIPVSVVNISTTLTSSTALETYLQTLEDKELAERFRTFLEKYDRKRLPTIQIPVSAITSKGLPDEIKKIVDARSITINLSKIFYLILETLGLNILNNKSTILLSDRY